MDARSDMDPVQLIRQKAQPLSQPRDLAPLIDRIKDARVVMLGESSHGTHEFYEWRRLISEWLITKHGFNFIAVEGDWPACQAVDRYVRRHEGADARSTMSAFHRWPTWMWGNTEIVRLAEWMRSHNSRVPRPQAAGFHGLDVYSLFDSVGAVLERLERINPFLARRARARYGCFDSYWEDEWRYARSLLESAESCEKDVVEMLQDLLKVSLGRGYEASEPVDEAIFDAQQNARVIVNAEHYYRNLVHGSEDSWNIRDRHMMDTLKVLLDRYGPRSKAIVWAHNTHIGDYAATDMLRRGQINIGGLAREQLGEKQVALVGFGTHRGSVIASHAWDGPIETMPVPEAKQGSWEDAFHRALSERRLAQAWLAFEPGDRRNALAEIHGHRAIGVVYDPKHERFGNYVPTSLSRRYDAFVFVEETRALTPLIQGFDRGEIPETYPAGQ